MLNNLEHLEPAPQITDRRRHSRIQVPFVVYVELGNGNGGLIPNISEAGFAVQASTILVGDNFSTLQFQLPESGTWIECAGRLAWQGASKKEAGIEFIDLHEESRDQIRNWISSQTVSGAVPAEKSNFNGVLETEEPDRRAGSDYTVDQTSPGEFDFSEFFPGEGKLTPKPAAGPDVLEVLNEELKPDSAPFAGANDSASSTESRRFEHPTGVYAQSTDRAGNLPSELRHEEPMPAAVPAMNQGSVGHGDPDSRAKVSISDVPVAGRSSYGETQQDVLSYAHATRACRDEFTPDENKSWRPLILTSVIAFVGGLGIAAFLLFGHRNFRALLSQGSTTTTDPFQGAAPRADVLSPSPAAPVPPAESDSDKQPNMPESSRSPGLPQLPPVAFAGVAGVRNQPPALSQPLQVGSFGKQGWIFLGQITPESTWAADYPKNVRSVPWPMEKGDHITISNEVSMRDGSRPSAHIVGRLHFGETVLVEEVALLHARLGGNFVWAKVSTAAAEKP